jgi:hypothetical protein
MKKLLLLLSLLLITSPIIGGLHYNLEDFEKPKVDGNIGIVNTEDSAYIRTSLSPNLELGPMKVVFDINLYIPLESDSPYPTDLNFLTFRYISFTHQDKHFIQYGRLRNITLGQGLLMDNYDTGAWGSTVFSSDKAGVHGFTNYKNVRVEALWTAQNVQGAHIKYRFDSTPLMDSPLEIGATIVSDPDGESRTIDGQRITRAKQGGKAVDIALPIGGNFFTPYAEYAELTTLQEAKGGAIGVKGDFLTMIQYRLEYRDLGEGFVPGYFNYTYHSTSFDFATDALSEQVKGYLASLSASFFDGYIRTGAMYEKYDTQDLFTASLGWKQIARTTGVVNYQVPFQGNRNRTLEAEAIVKSTRSFDYVIHYRRTYTTNDDFTESYSTGARFNLDNVFGLSL